MALWKSNDNESSKPSWLNEEQKRVCFRTVRGWEIPLGGIGSTGTTSNPFNQAYVTSSSSHVVQTELLVAMALKPSYTGQAQTNFANRGQTQGAVGATSGDATNNFNYAPYFTSPVNGATVRVPFGATAYLPVIAADCNTTDFGTAFTYSTTGATSVWDNTLLITSITSGVTASLGGAFTFPAGVTNATYTLGGWGGVTHGAAVLRINAGLTTGTHGLTGTVLDARGVTGTTNFNVIVY